MHALVRLPAQGKPSSRRWSASASAKRRSTSGCVPRSSARCTIARRRRAIGCRACQVHEAPRDSGPRVHGRIIAFSRDLKCEAVAPAVAVSRCMVCSFRPSAPCVSSLCSGHARWLLCYRRATPPPGSTTKRKRSRQPSEAARDQQKPPLKRAEVLAPVHEDDDVQMSPESELRPEQQEVIVRNVPGLRRPTDGSKTAHTSGRSTHGRRRRANPCSRRRIARGTRSQPRTRSRQRTTSSASPRRTSRQAADSLRGRMRKSSCVGRMSISEADLRHARRTSAAQEDAGSEPEAGPEQTLERVQESDQEFE